MAHCLTKPDFIDKPLSHKVIWAICLLAFSLKIIKREREGRGWPEDKVADCTGTDVLNGSVTEIILSLVL